MGDSHKHSINVIFMDKVSVIIPVCNRAEFVKDCVDSVLAQTYQDIEVLVIYEESQDNTLEILESYGDSITVIEKEPSRNEEGRYIVSMARNEGLRHATGDYVSMLDVDDSWAASKVEKQVAVFRGDPGIGVVYTYVVNINREGTIVGLRDRCPWFGRMNEYWLRKGFIANSSVLMRRSLIEKVGPIDEKMTNAEDFDLLLRLRQHCDFREVPEYLTFYRIHEAQKHRNRERLQLMARTALAKHDIKRPRPPHFRNVWRFAIRFIEKYCLKDYKYYTGEPLRETWLRDGFSREWRPEKKK